MTRNIVVACAIVVLVAGCKAETGASLEILASPSFEDDCTLSATPTAYRSYGWYDPTYEYGSYIMTLQLENLTVDDENPAAQTGQSNVKANANDAEIVGFDVCFYRGDDPSVVAYDSDGEGLPVACDDLPGNQRLFVTSSGSVESGGGLTSLSFQVLDDASLQTLYGSTFVPNDLPSGDDPTNLTTRSINWGDFPADTTTKVNLQVRARGKLQAGGTIRSNWFLFPVYVAPTTVRDDCWTVACEGGVIGTKLSSDSCGGERFSGAQYTCEEVDTCT